MSLLDYSDYLIVALALLGAAYNAQGMRLGFFIWIITNTYLTNKNFLSGEYAQCVLFFAYLLLSIYGFIRMGKQPTEGKPDSVK